MELPSVNSEAKDPLGHIKLAVGEFAKSSGFYKGLFEQLGYKQISDKESSAGWVSSAGLGIWVAQAEVSDYPYRHSAPGLHHLCLKAESPERVDNIHDFLVEEDSHIFSPPRHYPEYTNIYYAVFFADPDGIKLEVAYY